MCYMVLTSNQCSCGCLPVRDICFAAIHTQLTHTHTTEMRWQLWEQLCVFASNSTTGTMCVFSGAGPKSYEYTSTLCWWSKWPGSSRGCRTGPWQHSRRAGNLWSAVKMTTKVRNGGVTAFPPPPRSLQPAGPSHSVAQREAYTEAHQSTHTSPSGQGNTQE